MNVNDLLDIIGESEDSFVRDAHESRRSRGRRKMINIALGTAACLVLAPMMLFGGMMLFSGGFGAASEAPSAATPGNTGSDGEGYVYMSYAGPVLPLSTVESSDGLHAERNIDISFASYGDNGYREPTARITDSYILSNTTDEDMTVNALYPYIGSYSESTPRLSIDGSTRSFTDTELIYDPYTGTFVPVYGAQHITEDNDSHNLLDLSSFSGYEELLSDGSYLEAALAEVPALDMPVSVYRLSDYEYTADSSATNPTLNVAFEMDSEKTCVLTWNFNGGSNDWDSGRFERSVGAIKHRPSASPYNQIPADAYLIFVGKDIESYSIQGYKNGSCKASEKLDDLGCSITRYESTMGEVLRELLREFYAYDDVDSLYTLTAESLLSVGPLSEDGISRYDDGMLDSLVYDVQTQSRVCYLRFPVTVPAGSSVSIELSLSKTASHDYYGESSEEGLNGYELATTLGTELVFTAQSASISDFDSIEIVSQNFGFDPENGVTSVELDMSVSNYWINVREK